MIDGLILYHRGGESPEGNLWEIRPVGSTVRFASFVGPWEGACAYAQRFARDRGARLYGAGDVAA